MIENSLLPEFEGRWSAIRRAMAASCADACLLTQEINLFYTTGKIYSGYFYLSAHDGPLFFIKRPVGIEGENVFYIRKPEDIPAIMAKNGVAAPKKLLLEADELTYNEYVRLHNVFNSIPTDNATRMIRELRSVKSSYEISKLRESGQMHARVYSAIPSLFTSGMTDIQLQARIELRMREHGSLGIFRAFGPGMEIYSGSLLAGDNAATPSPYDFALGGAGIDPSFPLGPNGGVILPGTTIMVDMAGNYTSYMTDMTRVYCYGQIPDEAYMAHEVSISIHCRICEEVRPGTPCSEIYSIAAQMAADAGLSSNFMGITQQASFVGHGVGLQINELPVFFARSRDRLKENMVFALEPKFVLQGVGAVGIENTYLVTNSGLENLTVFPEQIICLDA